MKAALFLGGLLLVPVAAALHGASGPLPVRLNLGPGDERYLVGFFPEAEIAERVALHWSRPLAQVALPLLYTGGGHLSLRFGPPPGGPSRVGVRVGERTLGGFDCCRHRALQRRQLDAAAPSPTPLLISLEILGADVTDRGLFLDWVELEVAAGGRVWLTGAARWRPAALVGIVLLVLLAAGFTAAKAGLATTPLSLTLAAALLVDPWLVHRLLTLLPEALAVLVLPLTLVARGALRGEGAAPALRAAAALATLALLIRAGALNHPDFYYPDLRVHARLAAMVRETPSGFLRAPAVHLYTPRAEEAPTDTLVRATSGLWLRRIGGVDVGLPYSIAFHALLAPFARSTDGAIGVLKVLGAFFSALPVAVLAFMSVRLGAPPLAALLLVAAPTAFVELSLGSAPAVLGHAMDILLLAWLARWVGRADEPSSLLAGTFVVAAVQLAYVSSLLAAIAISGLLVVVLWRKSDTAAAIRLLAMLAGGSILSLLLYYRHFVGGALSAVRLAVAGQTGAAMPPFDPGGGRVDAALVFWLLPLGAVLAALGGIMLARRTSRSRAVLMAYALATILLVFLRTGLPSVFGFLHLSLLATPLLCLAIGEALGGLGIRGRKGRAAALVLMAALVVQGLFLQAGALSAQLANAR